MERMNEKAAELGLSEGAHFTNCVGLYAPEHRCTARDMALILRAAMENELCREILTTKRFHTAATDFHPEGQDLSNWFLRRIEDKDCGRRGGAVRQDRVCSGVRVLRGKLCPGRRRAGLSLRHRQRPQRLAGHL